jgi:photosystem II biogenesis protein Psp29
VNNVRTVSDTKRAFFNTYTRPVNSIYRRIVEELMVEMHLLGVNEDFRYDPIYALGVVSSFERFMQGYRSQQEKLAIFNALCKAQELDPQQYRQDSERAESVATHKSVDELIAWVTNAVNQESSDDPLEASLRAIATNAQFKYSRLFGIGLYTLLELADPEVVKDEQRRTEALHQLCVALNVSESKLQKDIELYRSNLEKMAQARKTIEDILQADRKKREQPASSPEETVAPSPQASSETPN